MYKLWKIPVGNTVSGPLILKFMQITVRENTFKLKSN